MLSAQSIVDRGGQHLGLVSRHRAPWADATLDSAALLVIEYGAMFVEATFEREAGFAGAYVLHRDKPQLGTRRVWPDGYTVRPDPVDPAPARWSVRSKRRSPSGPVPHRTRPAKTGLGDWLSGIREAVVPHGAAALRRTPTTTDRADALSAAGELYACPAALGCNGCATLDPHVLTPNHGRPWWSPGPKRCPVGPAGSDRPSRRVGRPDRSSGRPSGP
jgi:hypothetical protein